MSVKGKRRFKAIISYTCIALICLIIDLAIDDKNLVTIITCCIIYCDVPYEIYKFVREKLIQKRETR
jgi:hypothetical protein